MNSIRQFSSVEVFRRIRGLFSVIFRVFRTFGIIVVDIQIIRFGILIAVLSITKWILEPYSVTLEIW